MIPKCAYCGSVFDEDELNWDVEAADGGLMHSSCYIDWRDAA